LKEADDHKPEYSIAPTRLLSERRSTRLFSERRSNIDALATPAGTSPEQPPLASIEPELQVSWLSLSFRKSSNKVFTSTTTASEYFLFVGQGVFQ